MKTKKEIVMKEYEHLRGKRGYKLLLVLKSIALTLKDFNDSQELNEVFRIKFTFMDLWRQLFRIAKSYWAEEVLFQDFSDLRKIALKHWVQDNFHTPKFD
mgnify:CR=1 FL=1